MFFITFYFLLFTFYFHMRVQLRIVAGSLRGRKVICHSCPELRPTPDMVRQALFSILGEAVPDRPFYDIFAGSGVVGLEALSRGARTVLFLERDARLARDIEGHLQAFGFAEKGRVLRTNAYRWAAQAEAFAEPVNVFLSPPFADVQQRSEVMLGLIAQLQARLPPGSVLVLQSEKGSPLDTAAQLQNWEQRRYGRNVLFLWEAPAATGRSEQSAEGLAWEG